MQSVTVDTAKTFDMCALMACAPRLAFQSEEQEKAKDGTPKWEVSIAVAYTDSFGKPASEVIKVGMQSRTNPCESIPVLTPVELVDLTIGVMDRETRNRDTGMRELAGAATFFRCREIRPFNQPAADVQKLNNGRAKAEAAA